MYTIEFLHMPPPSAQVLLATPKQITIVVSVSYIPLDTLTHMQAKMHQPHPQMVQVCILIFSTLLLFFA